jgi:hypothetical protein
VAEGLEQPERQQQIGEPEDETAQDVRKPVDIEI